MILLTNENAPGIIPGRTFKVQTVSYKVKMAALANTIVIEAIIEDNGKKNITYINIDHNL